ncbi:aminopeptidase [Halalkalibacter akibai]|uniref:Aminopeptidase S n=1 Tax=Halalkalibacter akibai (strain ATCC 43226 / DSM 21942 / CIP 109018 / JCM 9157 / 1139) TaxID=1236973 RepID=W4QYY3_HALA3|nr:aminopeptidase [Halalkalibacter akibai]GAE36499.1 aminopeptidase S [Halalkalibacter akibai JCM 9157]
MSTFQEKVEKYAELAVKVGINIQKGQTLVVRTPISAADFVRVVAKKAYEAGAKNVHVEWNDEELTKTKYELAPDEAFHEFPEWVAKGYEEMADNGAAFLSITGSNPDLLKDADPERVSNANKASGKAMEGFRSYVMSDKISWSIVGVPSEGWAKKVFPDDSTDQAVEKLWEAIFAASRINEENPVAAWQEHLATLDQKMNSLNEKHYHALHYTSEGTDLIIELPETHLWVSGGSVNKDGVAFVANMPTEEVFTSAKKTGVNGVVSSTKPLNYGGTLINNFSLTFKDGKVIDFKAEEGYETLKRLLNTDEGSSFIGEVALVPHQSPISDTKILFYNTLFDENASNHLALGSAYAFCIEGGKEMSKEELEKAGLNTSLTHVDFMMGSADMNIDGVYADGKREPIFRDGNWAI